MKSLRKIFIGMSIMAVAATVSGCQKNDELIGFDIDLAKEVGKKLGVDVKFQEIIWEQKETELQSKQIDLIWNGMTITDERKAAMEISTSYMENKQVIVAKTSFNDTITENSNYTFAVEAGSAGSSTFDSEGVFAGSTKVEVTDQVTALTEVLSGTSNFAIIDSVMAGFYINDMDSYKGKLKILNDYNFKSEYYGIAARKNEEALISKINEALDDLYSDGTTKKIADKYGLKDTIVKPSDYKKYDDIEDKTSFDYIIDKKEIVIGYTIFAPIAYIK